LKDNDVEVAGLISREGPLITMGGNMAAEDSILPRLNEDSFAMSRLDHPIEFWGSPLGGSRRPDSDNNSRGKPTREARSFDFLKTKDLAAVTATGFQPHRILIGGTAILAALGVIAVAYIWSSADEKIAAQDQQSGVAVQSVPESPAQTASVTPQSSPDPSFAAAWPDLPVSTVETSANGSAALSETAAPRQAVSASQDQDIVFVQRPGVNIRSGPSANTRVLGSARKGTRLTVRNREGDWVQVESDRFSGWIRSRFLAANEPR
jgi:hypothetical protein